MPKLEETEQMRSQGRRVSLLAKAMSKMPSMQVHGTTPGSSAVSVFLLHNRIKLAISDTPKPGGLFLIYNVQTLFTPGHVLPAPSGRIVYGNMYPAWHQAVVSPQRGWRCLPHSIHPPRTKSHCRHQSHTCVLRGLVHVKPREETQNAVGGIISCSSI